ncbi:MAG: hypothetical protein ACQETD_00630 [Pseudomonadota bacterium]
MSDVLIVHQTLIGMSEKLAAEAHTLKGEFAAQQGVCDIIDQIIAVIEQRVRKIERTLGGSA